jgi:crossover junction endodeoxyribonuclease RuvC
VTRILGLDPGLRNTGWGIISCMQGRLSHVAHGVVHSEQKASLPERLHQLFTGLEEILTTYQPDEAAVEETFVNTNATSTLKLGMARGIVLLAPARLGLPVGEYSANKVKKSVVGAGHAEKQQVAMMVQRLLPTAGQVKLDAADALAVAICHAWHRETLQAWKK